MSSGIFHFKQFSVRHDKCAMKVGTDGVLLGAWCFPDDAFKVLDIGTGSGLIAIMIAQRNSKCNIDAVEIDPASFHQASYNAANCKWSKRITIHHTSFSEFCSHSNNKYDLIVSNPPWFSNSLMNPDPVRAAARHSSSLSMNDLIEGVQKLLSDTGRYCTIMPVPESEKFIKNAGPAGLFCRIITKVLPNPDRPPKRYLMEFQKMSGETTVSEIIIELDKRHKYSGEYERLTKDFYQQF
jgi:tRNA1Val (adenine37-N6)-methyltransferase